MSDPKADEIIVGKHEFRFVPPCQVSFVLRGTFEEEHAKVYTEFLTAHADRCAEPLDGLFDMSALTTIAPGARESSAPMSR